jgi:hypothetical protein
MTIEPATASGGDVAAPIAVTMAAIRPTRSARLPQADPVSAANALNLFLAQPATAVEPNPIRQSR